MKYAPRLFLFLMLIFGLCHFQPVIAQQWTIIGNESQVSAASSVNTSITVLDSVPYVVYREGTIGKVKRRNTSTGIWEQIGNNIGTNILYTRLYSDRNQNLYVAYMDVANGNKLAVEFYDSGSGTWEPLNSNAGNLYLSAGSINNGVTQFSSTPRFSMTFDSNNIPFIAFGDGANLTPFVKKFDGTSWVSVGGAAVSAGAIAIGVSLVIDEVDEPWLVFCSQASPTATAGNLALYHYDGAGWVPVSGTIASIRHTSMAVDAAGNLVIAYANTLNSVRATVVIFDKSAGTFSSGTLLSSRDAPYLSMISDLSGNLYCSFIDAINTSSLSVARVFKLSTGTTTWRELKDPVLTGIDNLVSQLTIASGADTTRPFIVYTKANSSSVSTPVVRYFIPPPAPAVLTTTGVSGFTQNSVVSGGNITDDGGQPITERGIVYGTNRFPNTTNTKIIDAAGGIGSYTSSISGLTQATVYYIRSYAINNGGITYGNEVKFATPYNPDQQVRTPMQMEKLDRGVVAIRTSASQVYVGWRLFGTDSASTSFNVYRNQVKLNSAPIISSTNYIDNTATDGAYTVRAVVGGVEQPASAQSTVLAKNYLDIPLQKPAGGTTPDGVAYTYRANDASVGDLDGDGKYEIILKWDPTNSKDNSQGGYTGNVYIDAYKLDGTRLWRIDLGRNIRAGAHYTQFMVYDLDGDGKAELACKTADATIDGAGIVIGNSNADYRNTGGYILSGPEYLTIFNGLTGAAMATNNYLPGRGTVGNWGDTYGNRVDRFIAAVAYLDGARPSLIMGRGYYTRLVRAAWDWRDGQLTLRWLFDSESGTAYDSTYSGNGNHQMAVGDVDGDGKQEVFNGSSGINDNGRGFWSNGMGHGDALHLSDMDPDRPGLEIWQPYETPSGNGKVGAALVDAKTGERIFTVAESSADVGRAMAADIDPRYKGYEVWAARGDLYTAKGVTIGTIKPSMNFGIWWDGDLLRELLDGTTIQKWEYATNTRTNLLSPDSVTSNNSTKATPCLTADIFGDWREEVIFRTLDDEHLRIYTTTIPTEHRIYTLMHDPQYRVAIAWQNGAYNQPPNPGFYLGADMAPAPAAEIYLAEQILLPVKLLDFSAKENQGSVALSWRTASEIHSRYFVVEKSRDGFNFSAIGQVAAAGNSASVKTYGLTDSIPFAGINYYRLRLVDLDGKFEYSSLVTATIKPAKASFIVSPNPVRNVVQISYSGISGKLSLQVVSASGKLLTTLKGSLSTLNSGLNKAIQSLSKGVYFLNFSDEANVYSTKIMKE